MKERIYLLLLLLFVGTCVAFSQTGVTGTVVDESNTPVIGASIQIKGTGQGTITDIDGSFTLTAPNNAILVFSYVGMHTQELPVSERMNVVLVSDSELLEELVVIGYGTLRKENLTGAVSSVDVEKTLEGRPITDVGRAL